MPKLRLRRPSHATAIAYLALFIALGGSSYAVVEISGRSIVDNSIRSRDLRDNGVRGVDIRRSNVQGSDVAPDALTGADIRESSLGTVPRASNASVLDGFDSSAFKVRCPAGDALIAGACIETTARSPLSQQNAMNACANSNRRLPSLSELRTLSVKVGTNIVNEYTGEFVKDGSVFAVVGSNNPTYALTDTTTPRAFRCVTGPSN
jgi:hypothetical protein